MSNPTTVISVRGQDRAALLADPDFVYVGRRCAGWPGSVWGNPWKPRDFDDGAKGCLEWYRQAAEAIYREDVASRAGRDDPGVREA